MAKSKAVKLKMREQLESSFNQATAAIVAEYKSVNANDLAHLRLVLRKAGCELKVIKNSIAVKAVQEERPQALKKYQSF